jgi:hypothetical protein
MTPVKGIQPDELEAVWPRVAGLIAAALMHSKRGFSLAEIKDQIAAQKRQLWASWPDCEAVGVTQVDAYPDSKVMTIVAFAGKMPADWRDILRRMEAHAAELGCGVIRLEGRPGWRRKLPADYRPGLIEFAKVIP